MIVRFPQAQGEEGGGAATLEVFIDGSSRPRGPAPTMWPTHTAALAALDRISLEEINVWKLNGFNANARSLEIILGNR